MRSIIKLLYQKTVEHTKPAADIFGWNIPLSLDVCTYICAPKQNFISKLSHRRVVWNRYFFAEQALRLREYLCISKEQFEAMREKTLSNLYGFDCLLVFPQEWRNALAKDVWALHKFKQNPWTWTKLFCLEILGFQSFSLCSVHFIIVGKEYIVVCFYAAVHVGGHFSHLLVGVIAEFDDDFPVRPIRIGR